MANAVAKSENANFSLAINNKLDSLGEALPQGFNKPRFVQNAIALLNEKPDLAKFGQTKILAGLMRGAMLGLDFYNHEAYLVPYGTDLQYQTSYIGSQKLVRKYSLRPVKNIYAELVREGDFFETGIEHNRRYFTFKPNPFSSKPIIGTFAVCEFVDGEILIEMMNNDEIQAARNQSKAKNAGAWSNFYGEMVKKVVIRRLCKKIEIDFENPEQQKIFESDTDIETEPTKIRDNQITQNANSVDFEEVQDAEVKPVPVEEVEKMVTPFQ